nr:antibiotic biosynthesis monooxygenase family protein [Pseudonocardia acidicola]
MLVCRFVVVPAEEPAFTARARRALELLTAAPGCLGGEFGRAVDDPQRWVLTVRFVSVDAYRRALSPFPVREHVVPLLSEALADEPAGYETLLRGEAGAVRAHESMLTGDRPATARPVRDGNLDVGGVSLPSLRPPE